MITSTANEKPLVVWYINDGKPGHLNQSLGLLQALEKRIPCESHALECLSVAALPGALLSGSFPAAANLSTPDLIIGTGHATHLTLLCAGRATGGRTVVLMRPSLPLSWFDYCLIPVHDMPLANDNVITTAGTLSRAWPGGEHDPATGLILVGGISRHFHWDTANVLRQVTAIAGDDNIRWQITDSRRTPGDMRTALVGLAAANIEYVAYDQVGADWLPARLAAAGTVWVSEDSMSMIYEALTSGAAVGLLELAAPTRDRLALANRALVDNGLVLTFSRWLDGQAFQVATTPLNEAQRCADLLLKRIDRTA